MQTDTEKFGLYFVIKQVYTDECILSSNVAFVWCITSAHYFPFQTKRYETVLNYAKMCQQRGTVEGEYLLHFCPV